MHARVRMISLAVSIAILSPALSHAQQTSASRTAPAAAGPRVELTATAVRQHAQTPDSAKSLAAAAARRKSMGQPIALMIVGGAAIVVGAVIGGDAGTIFMIGGAVAGLIGLYQYLQ